MFSLYVCAYVCTYIIDISVPQNVYKDILVFIPLNPISVKQPYITLYLISLGIMFLFKFQEH